MLHEALDKQFAFCHYLLRSNLEGISHEQSLVRPQPGGNCLNWVLGHVVASRSSFLPLLEQPPVWEAGSVRSYERDAAPDTPEDEILHLDEIMAALDRSQESLREGLPSLTPERQAERSPINPFHQKEETLGGLFTGLAFHEAYHVGQTGLLRRMAGLTGTV